MSALRRHLSHSAGPVRSLEADVAGADAAKNLALFQAFETSFGNAENKFSRRCDARDSLASSFVS